MGTAVSESLLEEAAELARRAGRLTLEWYSPTVEVVTKGDGSPVTAADRAAEQLLRSELIERFPRDAIMGEEHGYSGGASGRTWFIDPIDGTQSFIRGVPLFATLLALEDADGVAVGVIDLPALGETVMAGRGLGCFLNEQRIAVGDRSELNGSVLCTSSFDLIPDDTARRLQRSSVILRGWGDAYGYALLAAGRIEAMFDPVVKPWDVAPMAVVIPEAGGTFTDCTGRPDIRSGTGLATNGSLHDEILSIVAARD
ncbi:MAG: histidinol phosphate phosphatase [bacterium]|nr:histidinol phosphate phosphatase [bacterium]MDE0439489.1 histidinol phosphate phosphatase [bacterium]